MEILEKILKNNEVIQTLDKSSRVICNGIMQEALLVAGSFLMSKKKILVIKPNAYEAQLFSVAIASIIGNDNTMVFPVDESLRIEGIASSPEMVAQRVFILSELLKDQPMVLVAYTQGIIRCLPSRATFKENSLSLKVGQISDLGELLHKISLLGYRKTLKVEQSLEYAHRGSIIDVYSLNYADPIRIEFFDNEIESIRFFNINEQKTIKSVAEVTILAASELVLNDLTLEEGIGKIRTKLTNLLKNIKDEDIKENFNENIENRIEKIKERDYGATYYHYYSLLNEDCVSLVEFYNPDLTFIATYGHIKNNYQLLLEENFAYLEELYQKQESFLDLEINLDLNYCLNKNKKVVYIEDLKERDSDKEFLVREIISSNGNSKLFNALITRYLLEEEEVYICLDNENQIENVKMWLEEENLSHEAKIHFIKEQLNEGFEMVKEKIVFLTQKEIFNIKSQTSKFSSKFRSAISLNTYQELNPYDYVVHEEHGIGQYLGIKTMEVDGVHKDYLHIVYRGNSNLYVPLDQFKLVRKYVGKDGRIPKLNALNSKEWEKTKDRIKRRVDDMAEKLIQLYQERASIKGFAFSKEDDLERAFDNDFPYPLTKDQEKTIREVKEDMEKPYPMDRLICGDVGFGKTEIAFRAAFKAIKDGKQVAFLCPTTILARQHYYKAIERFQNFSVNIEVVSRLVPEKKQAKIIKDLKEGKVNLIIGTHRLLSKEFQYKNLGLLIVDEEQRFGVEHKEKIKQMKTDIDVLTLSATPIPRTLQMSLVGIRQLSQIQTAPDNRLPIQTYILERNEKVIKEIIERELGHSGQVFFLHNKISDIYGLATKIAHHIPKAKVAVGHGQMSHDELEDIMLSFYNNEINVLVCTTIIESGIDIPNANTIIIDDADCFGLSQLYQIKGRVGRSDRVAYAYLLYRPKKQLSETADKRLKAIKEFTELGSGYKIALRDLSIRGAGDILGSEQAGFIDDVGIDMYLSLLDEAIKKKTNNNDEKIESPKTPKVMQLDSYVPIEFASEDANKFEIYKEIEKVNSFAQLKELEFKINDNYGTIIRPVALLLEKKKMDLLSMNPAIDSINELPKYLEIILAESFSKINGIGVDLFEIVNKISPYTINLSFRNEKIKVRIEKKDDWSKVVVDFLKALEELNKRA